MLPFGQFCRVCFDFEADWPGGGEHQPQGRAEQGHRCHLPLFLVTAAELEAELRLFFLLALLDVMDPAGLSSLCVNNRLLDVMDPAGLSSLCNNVVHAVFKIFQ